MTSHAVFRYRRMLVGEGSSILRVTTQTELVGICHPQIVPRNSTMRIVAVCATHLSFPQRVMVRQAHLPALGLVAPQASIIRLPARLHHYLRFRDQVLHVAYPSRSHHIQTPIVFGVALRAVVVRLM